MSTDTFRALAIRRSKPRRSISIPKSLGIGALVVVSTFSMASVCGAAVLLTGAPYSQDFDSLPNSGTSPAWTNDSTLPGWSLFRQPVPGTAVPTIEVGTGSNNTGSFYSFGSAGSGERALGGVGSGSAYFGSPATATVAGWVAAAFTNDTGLAIDSFTVSYDGEQWRNGGNTSAQTTVLEYGFGSSFGAVSTWNTPGGSFDFMSPTVGATAGALDGNAAANRATGLGGTISSLAWIDGDTLWLRWIENNDTGNDHGLAIDNFDLTTTQVPEPSTLVLMLLGALGGVAAARPFRCR
ncbi:MAG: PEP-CTERM sorting domain-containing protein [Pirellulales bacterium]